MKLLRAAFRVVPLSAICLLGIVSACRDEVGRAANKQLIVLGFDGFDPRLAQRMLDEGRLPNFARLAAAGGFQPLGTATPPHSPVAWSSIITGTDPGRHGIFDWIHRDPETYAPYMCISKTTTGSGLRLPWGRYEIPVWGGDEVVNLRFGVPFWDYLTRSDVSAHVYRIPANYPPNEPEGPGDFLALTDMGTPDLRGTQGEFSFYTSGPFSASKSIAGGKVYRIRNRDVVRAKFYGPPDFLLDADAEDAGKPVEADFVIYRDPEKSTAVIEWDSTSVVLAEGEWSDWHTVDFQMGPGLGEARLQSMTGAIRLYLKKVHPYLELYVSPFQLDPLAGQAPISVPADFAAEVAEKVGRYYTQGLPEDTKALSGEIFTRDEFLQQAKLVHLERLKLLDLALDRYQSGFLFFYVGRTDQVAHMFWGAMLDEHPAITPEMHERYKGVMMDVYEEADGIVGKVMERFPQATLLCISDHGFTSFTRGFNLNTWLAENGYATLRSENRSTPLNFVWKNTRAYAIGLNGLYINVRGRERDGIVPAGDKQGLMDEIAAKLREVRDPDNGQQVIKEVYQSEAIYSPDHIDIGPDMVVGYAMGYRSSWATALGGAPRGLVEDNTEAWCGDHCVATDLVPGVVFSNKPIRRPNPTLEDIAPTVLDEFGIDIPPQMNGGSLFKP
jgi:predicted AlkP superfamily phosphohydrolase/phosphomutase